MGIILIILFVGLFLVLLLPAILLSLINTVLSWFGLAPRKRRTYYHWTTRDSGAGEEQYDRNVKTKTKSERKKLFDKNEGEYVDFEEMK